MDDVRWLSPEELSAWRGFLDVTRLLNERLQAQLLADDDFTMAEYDILVHLSEAPDLTLRMSHLARHAIQSRSRLTHTVGRLEMRDLVRRKACADDRRGIDCTLTEAGIQALEVAAPRHLKAVREHLFDRLDASQVSELGTLMRHLRAHLEPSLPAPA